MSFGQGGAMENSSWWMPHLWVIAIQLAAFVFYFLGSRRFYNLEEGWLKFVGLGILSDIFIAVGASSGLLPRMAENQGAPWHSVLFLTHITTVGLGLLGFLIIILYVLIRDRYRQYMRLSYFQYRILLPV